MTGTRSFPPPRLLPPPTTGRSAADTRDSTFTNNLPTMNTAYNSYSSKVNLILLLTMCLLYVFDFDRYLVLVHIKTLCQKHYAKNASVQQLYTATASLSAKRNKKGRNGWNKHNPKLDRFLRGPVPAKAGARAAAGSGAATISSRY